MTAPLPAILVISLPRSVERREVIAQRLNELGLPFSFFDGIDGYTLDPENLPAYDGLRRRLFYGRDMTAGELGCTLSHRAVLKKIADENIPHALILEDDALLSNDVPEILRALMKDGEWDMIRFLGRPKTLKTMREVRPLCGPYALTRVYGTPGGAYGYVVTCAAARRLLGFMQINWMPNDMILGQTWRTRLNVLSVRPAAICPDNDVPSTIGDARFRKEKDSLRGWEKLAHPFTRLGFKLWESAGKNIAWWRAR